MTSNCDATGLQAITDSATRQPSSRFTHDIKDHNNSILLGTDLLHKCWEDLSTHLAEGRCDDPEIQAAYREILATIPAVIDGIRTASKRIEETICCQPPGSQTTN